MLPIPGVDLENVFTLRTPDDANKIAENVKDKNVVIIGSSFIGELYSFNIFYPFCTNYSTRQFYTVTRTVQISMQEAS